MIEIYSILTEKPPYENIVFFLPFIICLVIGTVIGTKEFLKIQVRIPKDIIEYLVKMVCVFIVFLFMISHLIMSWFKLDKYINAMKNNSYNIVEGYVEDISTYTVKDGEDGVEVLFSLKGIAFDTGNSYGVNNKISQKDVI